MNVTEVLLSYMFQHRVIPFLPLLYHDLTSCNSVKSLLMVFNVECVSSRPVCLLLNDLPLISIWFLLVSTFR